jgi:ribosomal protein L35AE/L33A
MKYRSGIIDRIADDGYVIIRDMFKKDTNLRLFLDKQLVCPSGQRGRIVGSFGKSGKVRALFENGCPDLKKSRAVVMVLKKFLFDGAIK